MNGYLERLIRILNRLQDPLLLVIRLYWGWQFFEAGKGKFSNLSRVTSFFQDLNIPLPSLNAPVVATVECFGGLLLMIGLASRLVSIPLAFTMVVAYGTAHRESLRLIFSDPDKFTGEAPFLFLFATLLIIAFGPGRYSVDYFLRKLFSKSY